MRIAAITLALFAAAPAIAAVEVGPAPQPGAITRLPAEVGGRTEAQPGGGLLRQWPGTYFETAFRGTAAFFRIGAGDVRLHVFADGHDVATLTKPAPGLYRVAGLAPGTHRLRLEVASESQAGPTRFDGFFAGPGTAAAPLPHRTRAIELIGDSHTVGYGNTSPNGECSEDEVWATTDTSQSLGADLARRYGADYRINAISGRGVVRNYNGFAANTLPQAYPFLLFDKARQADDAGWRPQVIAVALGTNDFSTPLHAGERWADRAALHADYQATYVRFVQRLRARHPHALILLWATNLADGEIEREVARVVATLRGAGDARVGYVPVDGLAFSGCHGHPSVADDARIAEALAHAIDARPGVWSR